MKTIQNFTFEELVQAYLDCRRNKRNKPSSIAFELSLEANLCQLDEELRNGSYRPGRSICFVITRPKPREVWAADFRDLRAKAGTDKADAEGMESAQKLLGHKNITMTQHYVRKRLGERVKPTK